jgi:uncharacterized protein YfaP (DUF2135 family)
MACFPPCSPWCNCIDDECVPSPRTINALRLSTPDGRFVGAVTPAGGLLVASSGIAATARTFLFSPPTMWPLSSGDPLALDLCTPTWAPSGLLVRCDHQTIALPAQHKSDHLVTYEVGGPGTQVLATAGFPAGYPAYPGDDPAERIFRIIKLVGGQPAPNGTPIADGDTVAIRIDSNRGHTFFFRVLGPQSGAGIDGDGLAAGQAGCAFKVQFNEVRPTLGWRPPDGPCQSCAKVTVVVTDAASGQPISGATVVAQVPGHPYQGVTDAAGRVALADAAGRTCVPSGSVTILVTHNRHQTATVTASVPGAGQIEVDVHLSCTQVKGRLVDPFDSGIPGASVYLRDQSGQPILDQNGNPYHTTTGADGSFVFNCVPQGFIQVWTTADPSQTQHVKVVGPEGWTNVVIVIAAQTCGNIVGQVIDADTGQPIAGATVTEWGSGRQTTTDANGNFHFECVRPSGADTVSASAQGYVEDFRPVTVPASGNSASVVIPLHRPQVGQILIRLDWGSSPSDLDSHLSGPDGQGGQFHCAYFQRAPVGFVALDQDDVTAFGPETITISRDGGVFVAGDYHYWVHDFSRTTFSGSGASVAISTVDGQGMVNHVATFLVANAVGAQTDGLWHVVDLTIDATGGITQAVVQQLVAGDQSVVL